MKIEDRGRAKYRPLKDYDIDKVKLLLIDKIKHEQEMVHAMANEDEMAEIDRDFNKINLVSLFSGCGGLDFGVELAGLDAVIGKQKTNLALSRQENINKFRHESIFHTIYSVDMFKEANQTYKLNFPDSVVQTEKDIKKIKVFPNCDIVLGGFPCPGFSEAGPRLIDDERNFLYIHFIRCLIQTKPAFFIAENVKGMLTLGKGEVIKQIIQDFESAGYKVKYKLVNARDYGVPQLRERVFIIGVREDIDFEYEFPTPTHGNNDNQKPYITLRDAIGDLEADPGEWYEGSFSSIYLSRNRKKQWNEQSFTIQASGRQAPLHPGGKPMRKVGPDKWELPGGEESHRRLSIKEIARIQTFPDWFKFSDGNQTISINGRLNKIYKQIGNAVPVELARAIAYPIAEWSLKNMESVIEKRINSQQLEFFESIDR
ncbi:DNA cytosine methyltransferase [Metabacillus rhizolycopersici]|uniref:Cytosine-specific methyltransferase n=1 Tax=Metabacillus rhizolycopersici TaxID=2875709 RepID=A0ABS7UWN3_9BACI|nr:DNA cytosine methyltransferase [Metabacillus rhizolycopersici]MBZ5752457.1 DNA cytosine methyltransferase [Metabacillus rhizolycopersici]